MSALESRLSLWGPITRSGSDLHSSLFSSFGVYLLNNTYIYFFYGLFGFQFNLYYFTRKMSNSSLTSILMHRYFTSLVWVQRLDHSHHDILVGKRKPNNGLNPSINGEERCCTQIGTPKYMKRFSNAFEVWSHVVDHRKMSLIINGQVPPWCHYLYQACQKMKMKGKSSFFVNIFYFYSNYVLST